MPVRAGLEQFVDRTNHLGERLSDQGDGLRFVDGEGGCLAAAEANVNGDFIGLDECDVFDEQGHHALALDRRGARIVPYAVEILCKREDSRTRLLAEQPPVGGALALVFALQRVQLPQPVVPVGFQRIRDQAIVRDRPWR